MEDPVRPWHHSWCHVQTGGDCSCPNGVYDRHWSEEPEGGYKVTPAFPIQGDGRAKLLKVNRVEVIDSTGRAYVEMAARDVHLALQDGGYTLKVFLTNSPDA